MTSMIRTHQAPRIFAFILAGFTGFTVPAKAQLMSPQVLELKCDHIYEIQQRYLDRHLIYQSILTSNLEHRAMTQLIKRLDGFKMYLLQKDIGKIKKGLRPLFLSLKKNKCNGIFKVSKILNSRMEERVKFVEKFLGEKKFKFNPKVKIILDPDKRKRPKTMVEANDFHARYLQYQLANHLLSGTDLDEAKPRIIRNYKRILRQAKETPEREMLANYLDSFAHSLGPHTSFFSQEVLEDFKIRMRLSLEGIGATLSFQDGFTVIEQLIPGGAAYRSGRLKAKDKIIEVAQGEAGKAQNVIEMPLRDVVQLIRGKKGTKVRLTILRKGAEGSQRFSVALIRDKIKLEDEAAQITYIDRKLKGVKKKIALLHLPSFYADPRRGGRSAAKDMKRLCAQARAKKIDAMVLDLSDNGGGSLDDAVKVTGLFLRVGNVVKQSHRSPEKGEILLADRDPHVDWPGPLVVLMNRNSASASEIVGGALRDYKRALVVGDNSFGKGTVQSVENLLPGLGAMKVTVGMFNLPSGHSTQHHGVMADIKIPSAFSTDEIGEKTLDYSLPPKKIAPFLSHKAYVAEGRGAWKVVTPELISRLKKNSQARVSANKKFKELKEQIAKAQKRGDVIDVAEYYKERVETKKEEKKAKVSTGQTSKGNKKLSPGTGSVEDEMTSLRKERKKRYLERPDIQEAINIAMDMAIEYTPGLNITIGAQTPLGSGSANKGKKKSN